MFEIGEIIDGQYLALERRQGIRWITYSALDNISERVFVIKTPSEILGPTLFDIDRFNSAARSWINIGEKDEIAEAYLLKDYESAPHLFVEYIDGPTLEQILQAHNGQPLPIEQSLAAMKQILKGMVFLHTHNSGEANGEIVHGALFPRNIMVSEGNIRITDIGLSTAIRFPHGVMNAKVFLDNTAYMAPEQIENPEQTGKLADIYSFGVIMYEMITGTLPGTSEKTDDPLDGAANNAPASPSLQNPSCPPWLEETILKCMAREPENRFQSFEQIEALAKDMIKSSVISQKPENDGNGDRTSQVGGVRGEAKRESRRLDHYYLGVEHLMLALLATEGSLIMDYLGGEVGAEDVASKLSSKLPKGEGEWYWEGIRKTPRYERVMKMARRLRRKNDDERMRPQHILLAILKERNNLPVRVLRRMKIDIGAAIEKLEKELDRSRAAIRVEGLDSPIARFTRNLSDSSTETDTASFAERSLEMERALELLRKEKRGFVIVGKPGVGKAAFARELGRLLSTELTGVEMLQLRPASLLAFDEDEATVLETLKDVLSSAGESGLILFLDNLPSLLDMSAKAPSPEFANALEDAVTAGGLLLAGAATPQDYASCLTDNESLFKSLEVINLAEPSQEQAFEMLKKSKSIIESVHSVKIPDDALKAAIEFSVAFQTNRALPGRAVYALEHVCVGARLDVSASKESFDTLIITPEQIERVLARISQRNRNG